MYRKTVENKTNVIIEILIYEDDILVYVKTLKEPDDMLNFSLNRDRNIVLSYIKKRVRLKLSIKY